MSFLSAPHSAESVIRFLHAGLKNGSIILEREGQVNGALPVESTLEISDLDSSTLYLDIPTLQHEAELREPGMSSLKRAKSLGIYCIHVVRDMLSKHRQLTTARAHERLKNKFNALMAELEIEIKATIEEGMAENDVAADLTKISAHALTLTIEHAPDDIALHSAYIHQLINIAIIASERITRPAVSSLIQAHTKTPGFDFAIINGLMTIGEPAVDILIEYLSLPDEEMRMLAGRFLGEIGNIRALLPLVEAAKHEGDREVRETFMIAIERIRGNAPSAVSHSV